MAGPLELADATPAVAVQDAEFRRLLGFPKDHEVTGRALELMEWSRDWYAEHGRPWWYARRAASLALEEGSGGRRVEIEGAAFEASPLHATLVEADASAAALVAVGAGAGCETEARRRWEEGRPDEYFFLETYGSAVVEALLASAAFRLCEWADANGMAVLPHYSPGYPGWDIAEQRELLDLMRRRGRHDLPGGLSVLETGMLQPKKSLLAVFGLTAHVDRVERLTTLVPCTNCSLPGCRYRRAPYGRPLPRLEAAHPAPGGGAWGPASPLTRNARYSVAPGVLRRWAEQRLAIRVLEDRTVEAVFRYDGTTCSNLGRPLAFDYRIRLAPRDEGYTITHLSCAPAPGDDGHTFMCGFLENPAGLMRSIAAERPLLGHPLDAVVTWRRGHDVAGCYCRVESREHKWGLALETLHYALANAAER